MVRLSALELPTLPPTNGAPSLSGGAPLAAYVDLPRGEEPLTLASLSTDSPGLALGTAQGVVKRVTTDYPGAATTGSSSASRTATASSVPSSSPTGDEDLVFITSDAQLLHFPAPRGAPAGPRRPAAWPASSWPPGQRSVFFGVVDPAAPTPSSSRPAARRAPCPAPRPARSR